MDRGSTSLAGTVVLLIILSLLPAAASSQDGVAFTDFFSGAAGISPDAPGPGGKVGGVRIFPSDHIWNTRADNLPVDPHSDEYVNTIGRNAYLHPDFGSGTWEGHPIGIPFNVVNNGTQKARVKFDYSGESDRVLYPIPARPKIEGGSDRHQIPELRCK